jgi:predicted component of type VI protein secretion system
MFTGLNDGGATVGGVLGADCGEARMGLLGCLVPDTQHAFLVGLGIVDFNQHRAWLPCAPGFT